MSDASVRSFARGSDRSAYTRPNDRSGAAPMHGAQPDEEDA